VLNPVKCQFASIFELENFASVRHFGEHLGHKIVDYVPEQLHVRVEGENTGLVAHSLEFSLAEEVLPNLNVGLTVELDFFCLPLSAIESPEEHG
jgi:hypothetical protein